MAVDEVTLELDVVGVLGILVQLEVLAPGSKQLAERHLFLIDSDEGVRLAVLPAARAVELRRTMAPESDSP